MIEVSNKISTLKDIIEFGKPKDGTDDLLKILSLYRIELDKVNTKVLKMELPENPMSSAIMKL